MKFRSLIVGAALAALVGFAQPAAAQKPWTLDKSHTQVTFTVSHLGYSTMHGQFRTVDGTLSIDTAAPKNSKVEFTIDATSVDTNWAARDTHLKTKDFFDTANHPKITFVSTAVEPIDDKTATLRGNLTMLGKTLPVTFRAVLNKNAVHPMMGKDTIGFTATTTLKRSDWGMVYGVPLIGDEIQVTVNLEAMAG